jgi:hypothetical protein
MREGIVGILTGNANEVRNTLNSIKPGRIYRQRDNILAI